MANPAQNPLYKHFRQPAIYLKLPSLGRYWPDNAIDIPSTGEIPVYPMTVRDEIILKTPDALMNGEGVAATIQSCCPNIKDAWKLPQCDLDAVLIAIRLASYGSDMDIGSTCPHCKEPNDNVVNLRILLDNLAVPAYDTLTLDGLSINFKPQAFETMNNANLALFEQEKLINTITNSELSDDEKQKQFQTLMPKLTDLNVMSLVYCIESIELSDGTEVTEQKYIKEFIDNCDRNTFIAIKSKIEEINTNNKIAPLDIECNSCTKSYKTELNFEASNFFV
jgi:hypothetical protein